MCVAVTNFSCFRPEETKFNISIFCDHAFDYSDILLVCCLVDKTSKGTAPNNIHFY